MSIDKVNGLVIMMVASASFFFTTHAYAQNVEISSSLNPVGSGARATGMGGAFIGVADDATAASWNPAGLIQLEKPEVSAVYSIFEKEQTYTSKEPPDIGSEHNMDSDGLNYASAAYPFILLNRNMIVSLNYQRLYEMNKGIDVVHGEEGEFTMFEGIDISQNGYLYTISPAMAVQVTPELSLGATLNFWDNYVGKNGWNTSIESVQTTTASFDGITLEQIHADRYHYDFSFEGVNAHFGFLWSINSVFTLGGVYKTPFEADVQKRGSHYYSDYSVMRFPDDPDIEIGPLEGTESTDEDLVFKMPASYGLGLAYRHSDSLTISLDVYRTEWSRFIRVREDETEENPITGQSISEGRLEDTTQVRMGAEYLFINERYVLPVRLGVFYDPEPQTGHIDEFYGFSAGTGYTGKRFVLDSAYQFRTGRNLTGDIPYFEGTDVAVKQHTFMISSIIYF